MLDTDILRLIEPTMKPVVFNAVVRLEKLLDEINFISHHISVENAVSIDQGSPVDTAVAVSTGLP